MSAGAEIAEVSSPCSDSESATSARSSRYQRSATSGLPARPPPAWPADLLRRARDSVESGVECLDGEPAAAARSSSCTRSNRTSCAAAGSGSSPCRPRGGRLVSNPASRSGGQSCRRSIGTGTSPTAGVHGRRAGSRPRTAARVADRARTRRCPRSTRPPDARVETRGEDHRLLDAVAPAAMKKSSNHSVRAAAYAGDAIEAPGHGEAGCQPGRGPHRRTAPREGRRKSGLPKRFRATWRRPRPARWPRRSVMSQLSSSVLMRHFPSLRSSAPAISSFVSRSSRSLFTVGQLADGFDHHGCGDRP